MYCDISTSMVGVRGIPWLGTHELLALGVNAERDIINGLVLPKQA